MRTSFISPLLNLLQSDLKDLSLPVSHRESVRIIETRHDLNNI